MTTPDDRLRETLHGIAGTVTPVDLYERSLRRSRSIGRRRAASGASAALVALGLIGGGLWQLDPAGKQARPPAVAASRQAPPVNKPPVSTPPVSKQPRSRAISAVPGTLFYRQADDPGAVMRLRPGAAPMQVSAGQREDIAVSPDGKTFANVTEDGEVIVHDTAGGRPRTAYQGAQPEGYGPAWSPDGERLLIARRQAGAAQPGVLDVATGTFTTLSGDVAAGKHPRWSGDGRRIVYGVEPCRLKVADESGGSARTVPLLGDPEAAVNPGGVAACVPVSVDATGARAAVSLEAVGAGVDATLTPAETVVDLNTGEVLAIPVTGHVTAMLFHPDGNLLVRSTGDVGIILTLLSPAGEKLVEAAEPTTLKAFELVGYTR